MTGDHERRWQLFSGGGVSKALWSEIANLARENPERRGSNTYASRYRFTRKWNPFTYRDPY